MKATLNGKVIAESDDTVIVEGNHYFPRASLREEFVEASDHKSFCPWKGDCSYLHAVVDGQRSENAIWYYPDPLEKAVAVKDRVAFWKDVKVSA